MNSHLCYHRSGGDNQWCLKRFSASPTGSRVLAWRPAPRGCARGHEARLYPPRSAISTLPCTFCLMLPFYILYATANKKTAKCPLRGSRGGRGRFFFYLGSRTYLKSKCKGGPASGIRYGVRGLGLGLVRRSALCSLSGAVEKSHARNPQSHIPPHPESHTVHLV